MPDALTVAVERWPIAGAFTIARGTKTEAVVVVATVTRDGVTGRGECVPYARYGESVDGVMHELLAQADGGRGADRDDPPGRCRGGARKALDCALWAWPRARAACWVGRTRPAARHRITLSLGAPR
jgi:L-alanine-DL-glutamate epimerase-like enolase superfamily enzyme